MGNSTGKECDVTDFRANGRISSQRLREISGKFGIKMETVIQKKISE